jgi:hypothetical protein
MAYLAKGWNSKKIAKSLNTTKFRVDGLRRSINRFYGVNNPPGSMYRHLELTDSLKDNSSLELDFGFNFSK